MVCKDDKEKQGARNYRGELKVGQHRSQGMMMFSRRRGVIAKGTALSRLAGVVVANVNMQGR